MRSGFNRPLSHKRVSPTEDRKFRSLYQVPNMPSVDYRLLKNNSLVNALQYSFSSCIALGLVNSAIEECLSYPRIYSTWKLSFRISRHRNVWDSTKHALLNLEVIILKLKSLHVNIKYFEIRENLLTHTSCEGKECLRKNSSMRRFGKKTDKVIIAGQY